MFEIMERDQISPSLSQAQKLHKLAQIGKIMEQAGLPRLTYGVGENE